MKYLLSVLIMALSVSAYGFGNNSSSSQGQSQGQAQDQIQGQVAKSKVKNSGNSSSNSGVVASGNSLQGQSTDNAISYNQEATAASAAAISAMGCQVGMSGQVSGGGISSITDSKFCQALEMVKLHSAALLISTSESDRTYHTAAIHKYQALAGDYLDDTYTTGKVAEISGQLGQSVAWWAFIVWAI